MGILQIRQIVQHCLQFSDDLLHIALYEWMMAKQLDGELIRIAEPSLEKYLLKTSQQAQESATSLDLLWKYYENNNNHAAAANVLYKLATKSG